MKTSAVLALAAAGMVDMVSAHARLYGFSDEVTANGNAASYVDFPSSNDPIKDVTGSNMNCNTVGTKATTAKSVAGGSKLTFVWGHDAAQAATGKLPEEAIIARSHHGPVMTYISKEGANSWVKIQESGYIKASGDENTVDQLGVWATDVLISNNGRYEVTIPNLAPGKYTLRSEILALHEASNVGGAQFYPDCAHIEITGSGSVALPAGTAGESLYKATDAGVQFGIYNGGLDKYQIPGPKLWNGASSGGAAAPASSAAPAASSTKAATSAAPAATKPATSAAPAATTKATQAPAVSSSAAGYPVVEAPKPTSNKPSTLVTLTKTTSTTVQPAPTKEAASGAVAKYGRCGGEGWTGATTCVSGSTCKVQNPYYSQCI